MWRRILLEIIHRNYYPIFLTSCETRFIFKSLPALKWYSFQYKFMQNSFNYQTCLWRSSIYVVVKVYFKPLKTDNSNENI